MFQSSIKNILLGIDKIAGLEIVMDTESSCSYRIHIVSEKKGKIHSEVKYVVSKWEEAAALLHADTPVFLVLNGKGVIHKPFKKTDADEDAIQILNKVIPNMNVQDVYLQVFYSGHTGFLSIVRKQVLESHAKLILEKGFSIAAVSLGPFIAYDILCQLGLLKETSYVVNGHVFERNDKAELVAYTYDASRITSGDILLDGEKVAEASFLAYSAGVHLYLTDFGTDTTSCNYETEEGIKGHVWKSVKKRGGIALLVISFTLLLSNFIFYNIQFRKNNILKASYGTNQYKIKAIDSLQAEVKNKDRFLSDAGWLKHTKLSFYSDRIASTVLPSIKLTEFSLNPLDESASRAEKKLIFSTYHILIKGTCTSVADLNAWIKELQKDDSFKKVTIENFKYDSKINQSLFVIKIKLT